MNPDHDRIMARHRARQLATAIRDHEIGAAERARFYAVVGEPSPAPDLCPLNLPPTDDEMRDR